MVSLNVYANGLYLITGDIIDTNYTLPPRKDGQLIEIQHIPGPGDINCRNDWESYINPNIDLNFDNGDNNFLLLNQQQLLLIVKTLKKDKLLLIQEKNT